MSIYPPNQTTPRSGNYLWNWLGSPLKKFAAALAPYMGGGDGYTYTEINISSAELINPGVIPVGLGKELLPPCAANQYYEWKFNMEFLPGSTTYTTFGQINIYPDYLSIQTFTPAVQAALTANEYVVWKGNNIYAYDGYYGDVAGSSVYAEWNLGSFTDGDGSIKIKLWYKVVNFG